MSRIHYFQRYSQKENVITNNTLLLLARLYEESPKKFKIFLNELLGEEVFVGVIFDQQSKAKSSVPDGLIRQSSFNIVIEAKVGDNFNYQQLINHLSVFSEKRAERQFLLAIGSGEPSTEVSDRVREQISDLKIDVAFIPATFSRIIQVFNEVLSEYDLILRDLIDDYSEFCSIEGLLSADDRLRMVLAGRSRADNMKYGVYYNPKGFSKHKYIGLYWDKAIRAIGEIELIAEATVLIDTDEVLSPEVVLNTDQKSRIIDITKSARQNNGWDISHNHTFFLVNKFYPTEYHKVGYPPRGNRFFDLRELFGSASLPTTAEEIAHFLDGKTWP